MAVVQISRIQLRRGKKNEGTGMPQLASGELAWAIDTQELYIGNGAVSEGAPYVGNTKVLTEKDSIINIAGQYQYYYDNQIVVNETVKRSLQDRLDEGAVNVKSFGVISYPYPASSLETVESQTARIQAAINEISSNTRVTLEFDAGEFRFDSSIVLPSNVRIKGQGKDHTVLHFTEVGSGLVAENFAERILLKDLTLRISNTQTSAVVLENNKNCIFEDLKITFDDGTPVSPGGALDNSVGIRMLGLNVVSNNLFSNVEFTRLSYGVYSNSGSSFNSFENCNFNNLYKGVVLGDNPLYKANYNVVSHSVFTDILNEGIEVVSGYGNKSISNRFRNVSSSQAGVLSTSSIIKFHSDKNSSIDDYFERQQLQQEYNTPYSGNLYLPEVDGISYYAKNDPVRVILEYVAPPFPQTAITIPLKDLNSIKIEYVINSLPYDVYRRGTMHVMVDKISGQIELTDDYEVRGETEDSIVFSGAVELQSGTKVLRIKYVNSAVYVADRNELTYTYSVLS